ncbi:hypothetical protein ACFL4R_01265 [Nitrospirota bacterium]
MVISRKPYKENLMRVIVAALGIGISATILYYYSSYLVSHPPSWDVRQYFEYGKEIEAKGLFGYSHPFRTYMFPLYISLIPFNLEDGFGGFISSFAYIQSSLFIVSSCVILFLIRDSRYFFHFLFGVCINPLVLIYIPVPLTESLVCLVIMVLFAFVANSDRIKPVFFVIAAGTMGGTLVVIRPASIFIGAGLIVFCLLYIWRQYKYRKESTHAYKPVLSFILIVCLGISFIIPISVQYYLNYKQHKKVSFIASDLGSFQLKEGIELYKYGTLFLSRKGWFTGMRYESGIAPPADEKYLLFYFKNPLKGAKLALTHIYSALNYDFLEPYIYSKFKRISFYQILSSLITILGFFGLVSYWAGNFKRNEMPVNLYTLADILILFQIPMLAVVAVETRFGLIVTMFLSVRAVALLFEVNKMKFRMMIFILIFTVTYVVCSVQFSEHLYSKVKLRTPPVTYLWDE